VDCQPAERQDHFLYTSDGYVKSAVVHEDRDVGRLTRRVLRFTGMSSSVWICGSANDNDSEGLMLARTIYKIYDREALRCKSFLFS